MQTTEAKIKSLSYFNLVNNLKIILQSLEDTSVVPAAAISAIGTTTAITSVPASFSDEAAVRTYLAAAIPIIESRLDVIEAKDDAIIAALKTAGLMNS